MTRVLVTGAGGPAGVAAIRSLLHRANVDVFSADMDGWASGLYLVDGDHRSIVPPGAAAGFVDGVMQRCTADRIDVLFSTVDSELLPLARRRRELESRGTSLAAPARATLEVALDKFALAERCAPLLRVPVTVLLDGDGIGMPWRFPVIVKPRRGSGSRGVRLIGGRAALEALVPDGDTIIQEHLPGAEYSVDVIAEAGRVVAAVPRSRERVDSGVSIAGRTVRDAQLERTAAAAAHAIALNGVANVQLRRDRDGMPALLEINPRFPGAMPLTIAAGVDLPSLALDLALGIPLPEHIDYAELANVRFLEDVFLDPSEILSSEHAAHDEGGAR
ncbi:MAG TPA: ATP-grasp domain-containing protein [Pseudolysinimonas sp.]|nr:ATP-grasp domain-containing protein [Pseudolysinimonas sp.]